MNNKRKRAGILLPLFSLPNRYGIGSLGREAYDFLNFLKRSGQSYWQMLPLNFTGYGDSPYQSPCAYSGSPYYIDLEALKSCGYLTDEDLASESTDYGVIDYGRLFSTRIKTLKKAYSVFSLSAHADFEAFCKKNAWWLNDFAVFMSVKEENGYVCRTRFPENLQFKNDIKPLSRYEQPARFWRFTQYCFYVQYTALKKRANALGIRIIGDMPIYVSSDSSDLWSSPKNFILDEKGGVNAVAGVPPDAFCDGGQKWGNPLYDYGYMAETDFEWWKKRLKFGMKYYDAIRIDHFRGFESFYAVPEKDADAKRGEWIRGRGYELFESVKKSFPKLRLIAEDLGVITPEVKKLLEFTGYPGMKVLQFAFDGNPENEYLPQNFKDSNCYAYTGTHDNPPTKAWFEELSDGAKKYVLSLMPYDKRRSFCTNFVQWLLNSRAQTVIIPLQDYLESGAEARVNEPATTEKNWKWRMERNCCTSRLSGKILRMAKESGRAAE